MSDFNDEPKPYTEILNEAPIRKIDFIGLDLPNYENEDDIPVNYEINQESQFHITRALFVGNLRKPINAGQFQVYLKQLIKSNGYYIERCWLNKLRTHAIILINNEEGAEFLRNKLLNSKYPTKEEDSLLKEEFQDKEIERYESELKHYQELSSEAKESILPPIEPREFEVERLPLYVEYIPVKAINQWTYEEDKGPRNGKWKLEFEFRGEDKSDPVASHTLLNGDFIPRYHHQPRMNRHRGHYNGYNNYNNSGRYHDERQYNQSRIGGGGGGSTDSYVPGGISRERSSLLYIPRQTNTKTDSYVPGGRRRSRSPSRSRSPERF